VGEIRRVRRECESKDGSVKVKKNGGLMWWWKEEGKGGFFFFNVNFHVGEDMEMHIIKLATPLFFWSKCAWGLVNAKGVMLRGQNRTF